MEEVHTFVYVLYSLGKSCMTSLWIRWCFSYLSSILQLSLSLQDGYARGAEDSGDTTSLSAVAMASVLLGNTIFVKLKLWELVIVFNKTFWSATSICLRLWQVIRHLGLLFFAI